MNLTNPSPSFRRPVCFALLVCLLVTGGCGYQQGNGNGGGTVGGYHWASLYRTDVKTVAVPIFTNSTYYRGVEFNLTKAVVTQLETHTPYKVLPKEKADTILEGQVHDIRVRTISNSPFNSLPQEQLYEVTVDFTWKDLRTGKLYCQRKEFRQTAPYYPTLGEGQFTGQQQNVERLALAIVQEMQADW